MFLFQTLLLKCRRDTAGRHVKYVLVDKIPLNLVIVKHHVSGNNIDSELFYFHHDEVFPAVLNLFVFVCLIAEFKSLHLHAFEIVRLDIVGVFPILCASYEDKTRWLRSLDQLVKKKTAYSFADTDPQMVAKIEETRQTRTTQSPSNYTTDLKEAISEISAE